MKNRKIFTMHKSKVVVLPKKFFKQGLLDETKPIRFIVQDGKIVISQTNNGEQLSPFRKEVPA